MKVGDSVRCVNKTYSYITFGKVYKVRDVRDSEVYIKDDDGYYYWYNKEDFELVDEFKPTKSFLKSTSEIFAAMLSNGEIVRLDFYLEKNKYKYNEDLTSEVYHNIDKIFRIDEIWEREEAKVMTQAEIEAELGYKIRLKEEE